MSMQNVAAAMQRVEAVLQRRPQAGIKDDAGAIARWQGDTPVAVDHANGARFHADMPPELGGQRSDVSPGWLFDAGRAACAASVIAVRAAAKGIGLQALEVVVGTCSDALGLFGMRDADGVTVGAGPLQLHVRIAARGASDERLRRLVERAHACSPVARVAQNAVPIALHVDVGAD